ncbi:hypothetical protein [Streptomyces sp. NPDC050145]
MRALFRAALAGIALALLLTSCPRAGAIPELAPAPNSPKGASTWP